MGVSAPVGKERLGVTEGMGVGGEAFNNGASFGPGGRRRSPLVDKERSEHLGFTEGMGVGGETFNMGASFGPGGRRRGAKYSLLNILVNS